MFAADLVLIPTGCDYLSADAVIDTLNTLQAVLDRQGRCRLMGVLPTMYHERASISKEILEEMRANPRIGQALMAEIHHATVLKAAAYRGKTIWEYAPKSRAAEEYGRVVWEVLDLGQQWQRHVTLGEARRELQLVHRRHLLDWIYAQFRAGVPPDHLYDRLAA